LTYVSLLLPFVSDSQMLKGGAKIKVGLRRDMGS